MSLVNDMQQQCQARNLFDVFAKLFQSMRKPSNLEEWHKLLLVERLELFQSSKKQNPKLCKSLISPLLVVVLIAEKTLYTGSLGIMLSLMTCRSVLTPLFKRLSAINAESLLMDSIV